MVERDKVIFIIGNSRSGTTLMAKILNNNKSVYSFNELHFFENFWTEKDCFFDLQRAKSVLTRLFCSSRLHTYSKCEEKLFREEIEAFLQDFSFPVNGIEVFKKFLYYETRKNNKQIPCEQTPRNLFYLKSILEYFPEAKIIYMVRDPRDTTLSQKYKWKRFFKAKNEPYPLSESIRNLVNYHPITISLLWRSSANAILPYLENDNVLMVQFEELISNPEENVKKVCEFLGLDYQKSMLDVPFAFSSIFNDDNKKGFDKKRMGNWRLKLNSAEIFFIQKINENLMQKFGYKPEKIFPNPVCFLYYLISFVPKTVLAVLFNLSRNKNIFVSIYKRVKGLIL
ncbi:sulfotransferase family protein [Nautilia sp.]